jgi:hypothetical protein
MKIVLLMILSLFSWASFGWGQIGHRVVAKIAYDHLSAKSKKEIKKLLGPESLPKISTWADSLYSDPNWKKQETWHYLSIRDGQTLATAERNPKGDILSAIDHYTPLLANPQASKAERVEALKFLVHLLADVHQPLHVGRPEDQGGNLIPMKWFGQDLTLHQVWDEGIINHEELSFTEYASFLEETPGEESKEWKKGTPADWLMESFELSKKVYKDVEGIQELSYQYQFDQVGIIHQRLLQAGLRLAWYLDNLFQGRRQGRPQGIR